MPRGPHGSAKNCVESNITGGGNCYFVDSKHSNSWRLLRINNADENLAYVEYDPAYAWETTDATGAGLQYYELCEDLDTCPDRSDPPSLSHHFRAWRVGSPVRATASHSVPRRRRGARPVPDGEHVRRR